MIKKCTPLWREWHFQVKMHKTPQLRSTFRSWDDEKVHAVVVQSTFLSQNVQNTSASEHFQKLRWWKSACRCGAKHISKSKCTKHTLLGPLLEVEISNSSRRCGAKHISKSKCSKHNMPGPLLKVQMWFWVAGARDSAPCQKWAKREDFVAFPKTMAGVGHLKWICQDAFSVVGAVQETCSSEMLGGPGANFLRGVAFWASNLQFWEDYFAALRMTWLLFSVAGTIL